MARKWFTKRDRSNAARAIDAAVWRLVVSDRRRRHIVHLRRSRFGGPPVLRMPTPQELRGRNREGHAVACGQMDCEI